MFTLNHYQYFLGHLDSGSLRDNMAFWSGKLIYFIRLLVYFICFFAFAIQFGNLFGNVSKPTITNTNVEERELREIGFPLILKICVGPGFNKTAINEAGYSSSYDFFIGRSMYNE